MAGANLTVQGRQLARRLRELRLHTGMDIAETAKRLLCSPAKISRIETAQRPASLRDVRDLCRLYGLDESQTEDMMRLAKDAQKQDWWQAYDDPDFRPYLSLESEATSITEYETTTIPGLFQTEEYARAVIRGWLPDIMDDILQERVQARTKRQERLHGANPPLYRALLDESVLHRHVGGREVMRRQLEQVVKLAQLRHVTVQVIPFTVGAHMGFNSAFQFLEFDSELGPVVGLETLMGHFFLEKPKDIKRFLEAISHSSAVAMSPAESIAKIEAVSRTF